MPGEPAAPTVQAGTPETPPAPPADPVAPVASPPGDPVAPDPPPSPAPESPDAPDGPERVASWDVTQRPARALIPGAPEGAVEAETPPPAGPAVAPAPSPEELSARLAARRVAIHAAKRAFEALLFVQTDGVKLREAAKTLGIPYPVAKDAMDELVDDYALRGGGLIILREKGGFSLATAPDLADALAAFVEVRDVRLSRAAYETLAVIALRQPITKPEIERIRGVSVDGVIGSLRERGFVRVMGRKKLVGQPKLFGVGMMFFKHFGIRSLRELRDFALKLKGVEGEAAGAENEALATLGTLMGDIAIAPAHEGEALVVAPPVDPPPDAAAADAPAGPGSEAGDAADGEDAFDDEAPDDDDDADGEDPADGGA